jgi:hypothetical protein
MVPAAVAFLMLAVALVLFVHSRLLSELIRYAGITLPAGNVYVDIAIILALSFLALLRVWSEGRLKIIMYLSFALYLPFAIYFSGIYSLVGVGDGLRLGFFSTDLPREAIVVAGIVLACGGLLLQSFSRMGKARENFLMRGADADEVDRALYKGFGFEAKAIAASAAAVLLIIAGTALAGPAILWMLRFVSFFYVLAGMAGALILGLIILVYTHKNGEKG